MTRDYGSYFNLIFKENFTPDLDPGSPFKKLNKIDLETAFANKEIKNKNMALACLSGLYLYFNYLDESHNLSQNIKTKEGSYWHAIMHRKEGDYWNSNYWFAKVGQHEIFKALLESAKSIARDLKLDEVLEMLNKQKNWKAEIFNEQVEEALSRDSSSKLYQYCLTVQKEEMLLLFGFCYERV